MQLWPAVDEARADAGLGRALEVGVLQDEVGVAAAQLQHRLLQGAAGSRGHVASGRRAAGQGHRPHLRRIDDLAHARGRDEEDLEGAVAGRRGGPDVLDGERAAGHVGGVLEQADVAGHEGRGREAEDLPEGKVPRHHGQHGAEGVVAHVAAPGLRRHLLEGEVFGRARARSDRNRWRTSPPPPGPAAAACPSRRPSGGPDRRHARGGAWPRGRRCAPGRRRSSYASREGGLGGLEGLRDGGGAGLFVLADGGPGGGIDGLERHVDLLRGMTRRQPRVLTQQRRTSATLQAWATHPRGVYGGSASKISLIDPMQASPRWGTKPLQEGSGTGELARVELQPGVDEGPDEPAPHRPLVVGGVARAQVAVVPGLVVGMAGGQRAQAHRREQPLLHDVHHARPIAHARAPDGPARWRRPGWAGRRRRCRRPPRPRRRRGSRPRRTRSAR